MPDDLTFQYRRLAHSAALVAEFDGSPDRQAELLRWTLEAVRVIANARGIPLRAVMACAGCGVPAFDGVCAACEAEAERGWNALNRQEHAAGLHPEGCTCQSGVTRASPEPMPRRISRDLFPAQGASPEAVCGRILTASGESLREAGADVPRLVPLAWDSEVGCRVTEDAAERVLQAGERRRAAEEPPIEAGAGFAPGELARPVSPAEIDGKSDPEHVCGLQGFHPGLDGRCPGCVAWEQRFAARPVWGGVEEHE